MGLDSPIERLFLAQMMAEEWGYDHPQFTWTDAHRIVTGFGIKARGSILLCDGCVAVCAVQAEVTYGRDSFRIDFAFVDDTPDRIIKLAVELDGHDYHERTKEQASRDKRRDRVLAANGWTTLRFTGSDIYADPLKALDEVVDHANALSLGRETADGLRENRACNRERWKR
jgi:very-short-patch-repair endonuclease